MRTFRVFGIVVVLVMGRIFVVVWKAENASHPKEDHSRADKLGRLTARNFVQPVAEEWYANSQQKEKHLGQRSIATATKAPSEAPNWSKDWFYK